MVNMAKMTNVNIFCKCDDCEYNDYGYCERDSIYLDENGKCRGVSFKNEEREGYDNVKDD